MGDSEFRMTYSELVIILYEYVETKGIFYCRMTLQDEHAGFCRMVRYLE